MQMPAVIEAALTEEGPEVRERPLQLPLRQVMQSKLLEPWRVDQRSASRERIQPRKRGRVPATVQRLRYLARRDFGVRHQDVHQRPFTHARLSKQQGGAVCQTRIEFFMDALRRRLRR